MPQSQTISRAGAVHRVLPVLHVLSLVITLFSFTMAIPLLTSLWYRDSAQIAYYKSIAVTFASGMLLWFSTRRYKRELMVRDSLLLVGLVWTVFVLLTGAFWRR